MCGIILHKPASIHYAHPMNATRILAPSLITCALFSCAPSKSDNYDTQRPVPAPATAQATQPAAPANPVYDTPPAYEESTATATAAGSPAGNTAGKPGAARPAAALPATPATNGAATIHVVVAGDTLGKISKQYHVPIASIKQANHMTNDIVRLGGKLVIPPH